MRARLSTADLAAAVKFTSTAIAGRPVAPVLAGVLITEAEDGIELRAQDYDMSTVARVPALAAEIPEPVLVSHRLLSQVLAVCGSDVDLGREPGGMVAVASGRARWELPAMEAELYPPAPAVPAALGQVDAKDLRDAAKIVSASAAADDDANIGLSALALEFGDHGVDVVASDSRRLATARIDWQPVLEQVGDEPVRVLVPARTFARLVDGMTGAVQISCDASTVHLAANGRALSMRQIAPASGKWISWRPLMRHVAAERFVTTAVADRDALTLALRQAMALAPTEVNKQRLLALTLLPGEGGRVEAGDQDLGSRSGIDFEAEVVGRPARMVTAAAYILDALPCVPGDVVQLGIVEPQMSPLGLGEPGRDAVALAMPTRRPEAGWLDEQ